MKESDSDKSTKIFALLIFLIIINIMLIWQVSVLIGVGLSIWYFVANYTLGFTQCMFYRVLIMGSKVRDGGEKNENL